LNGGIIMTINISINISQYMNQAGTITPQKCREWCSTQQYQAAYSGFLTLLCFDLLLAGVFMLLFKYSDKVVHHTKLSEEQLSIILNSVVSLMFWANALYGLYWMFIR